MRLYRSDDLLKPSERLSVEARERYEENDAEETRSVSERCCLD